MRMCKIRKTIVLGTPNFAKTTPNFFLGVVFYVFHHLWPKRRQVELIRRIVFTLPFGRGESGDGLEGAVK